MTPESPPKRLRQRCVADHRGVIAGPRHLVIGERAAERGADAERGEEPAVDA